MTLILLTCLIAIGTRGAVAANAASVSDDPPKADVDVVLNAPQGNAEAYERHLRSAIAQRPESAYLRANLAWHLIISRRCNEATPLLARPKAIAPRARWLADIEAKYLEICKGDLAGARSLRKRALQVAQPTNAPEESAHASDELAKSYLAEGKILAATEAAKEAVRLKPYSAHLLTLAFCYRDLGRLDLYEKTLLEIIRNDSNPSDTYVYLIYLYNYVGWRNEVTWAATQAVRSGHSYPQSLTYQPDQVRDRKRFYSRGFQTTTHTHRLPYEREVWPARRR